MAGATRPKRRALQTVCWCGETNINKKLISNDEQVTLFERKFERRRPLLHASAYYATCRGDDPRAAVAENGVCRSWPLTYTLCPSVVCVRANCYVGQGANVSERV